MRGLAILIMIEAHVLDAWTRPSDRQTLAFGISAILAGFAAPMFLFLAGVSVALAACAGARKSGERRAGRGPRAASGLAGLRPRLPVPVPGVHPEPEGDAVRGAQGGHPQHHGAVDRRGGRALAGWARDTRRRILALRRAPRWRSRSLTPLVRATPLVDCAAGARAVVPAPDAGQEQLHVLSRGRASSSPVRSSAS